MVKFSKELEAQLIPEWKDAFANYWQLKKEIKKIKLSRILKQTHLDQRFGHSVLNPIRFFVNKFINSGKKTTSADATTTIQFNTNPTSNDDELQVYQTELHQLSSHDDKSGIGLNTVSRRQEVKYFFEVLDGELNKVNQFYQTKEDEFVERGDLLLNQLQILLQLNQFLTDRLRKQNPPPLPSLLSSSRPSRYSESVEASSAENIETGEIIAALEKHGNDSARRTGTKKELAKTVKRIGITSMTPAQTITSVMSLLWEDLVSNPKKEGNGSVNRKKIQCAEKIIRGAFVELYRGLGLLRTFSSLNILAFTKILKKFDKVVNQQSSESYLRVVKRSHFTCSDKVLSLMDQVESIFTKNFANNERKKAMKYLRPRQQKESHTVTFFMGLFTGCFVSLFTVYAILAHLAGVFSPTKGIAYMEKIYPIFSIFSLLSLHLFMYGCDLFMWRTTRINCNFIFEFQPSTALKYREIFLICTTSMSCVVGAMILHLLLHGNGFSSSYVDAIPGILILSFLVLFICPLNILYRPTRYCFLQIMRNIVCSPFYKVVMVDFFMADQLTSQISLLRHLESVTCYFLIGGSKLVYNNKTCMSSSLYRELAYVISFLPYYWRAMQCARRWFDEHDLDHLANMGKYVSAMVAAGARITYSRKSDNVWFAIVLGTSVLATIYQLYWDFVKDWGLLNRKSENPWLRDNLVLKTKGIYYASMALNVVLRVVWVGTIMGFRFNTAESRLLEFLLASLEIIRRGHWNFYRLENEHLNNVGKFRAVKAVPLPFRDID